ncbi:pentatricopeptide repeat-containing protein [Trifolium medium]|uniref:Pentatricopeptide repeat-containing protein n=1 Tax=Trifolium medium TaxID=97028 RepID=A0A392M1R8_9FABA|nr:pentatricopeptide repeat-containing protein [Trifolium medium]
MGDRIEATEGQMGEMKATMLQLSQQMQQQQSAMLQQSNLLNELSKRLGVNTSLEVSQEGETSVETDRSQESRLSGKKDGLSWEKLKKALIVRYGGHRWENPFDELSTLRQKSGVEEYVEPLELLSSQVGRLPEEQYLGYFMSGLKPQIRRRVRILNPQSRMQMMRMAKDVEDELCEEDDEERGVSKNGVNDKSGRSD